MKKFENKRVLYLFQNNRITLVALVVTIVVRYVKNQKYSNNNSFLLMNS